jgi:sugar lactone lactonase YvrE
MKPKNILWPGALLVIGLFSCKKDSSPQGSAPINPPNPPVSPTAVAISGISPSSGPFATVVTISGSNFNADATKDTVWFDSVAAVVQQATAVQLTVAVPKSAGTGAVIVKSGTSAMGPVFNYVYTTTVSTLAGNGTAGMVNSTGSGAEFSSPSGLVLNATGSFLYVADRGNNSIRGLTSGAATGGGQNSPPGGITSAYAGAGGSGNVDGAVGTAKFNGPAGLAMDPSANVYVSDAQNNVVRKISAGTVSTLAGSTIGFADGKGVAAKFSAPAGLISDNAGNIYVSDQANQRIRKIAPDGTVTTIAGTNAPGFLDGKGSAAAFRYPGGLGIDKQGNLYVADVSNNSIRKVTPDGTVSTIGGTGALGYYDGPAATSRFYFPSGVAVDGHGNVYVADTYNNCIRMITASGTVSTVAGNPAVAGGFKDGAGNAALFDRPIDLVIDTQGDLYVSDGLNNRIRKVVTE